MNRKDIKIKGDSKVKEFNEMLFDIYVKRRWFYIGGNFGNHLLYYNIYNKGSKLSSVDIDSCVCYLCQRELSIRDKMFYITDYRKKKVIGKCCLKKSEYVCFLYCSDDEGVVYNYKIRRFKLKSD